MMLPELDSQPGQSITFFRKHSGGTPPCDTQIACTHLMGAGFFVARLMERTGHGWLAGRGEGSVEKVGVTAHSPGA